MAALKSKRLFTFFPPQSTFHPTIEDQPPCKVCFDQVVKKNKFFPFLIISLTTFGLICVSAFFVYQKIQNDKILSLVSSYEECASLPTSTILTSYPATCIAQDGKSFIQSISEATPQPTPSADPEIICTDSGGKWLEKYQECEGITEQVCALAGGEFEECDSSCRHVSDPSAPCIMVCVAVCRL